MSLGDSVWNFQCGKNAPHTIYLFRVHDYLHFSEVIISPEIFFSNLKFPIKNPLQNTLNKYNQLQL